LRQGFVCGFKDRRLVEFTTAPKRLQVQRSLDVLWSWKGSRLSPLSPT
jgi:hypothetical protein